MIHHRIDIPRADKKAESRLAEFFKIITGVPIGLCDYADGITETFQKSADHRVRKTRVVNICVTRYIYKVKAVDAAVLHILATKRQKS